MKNYGFSKLSFFVSPGFALTHGWQIAEFSTTIHAYGWNGTIKILSNFNVLTDFSQTRRQYM